MSDILNFTFETSGGTIVVPLAPGEDLVQEIGSAAEDAGHGSGSILLVDVDVNPALINVIGLDLTTWVTASRAAAGMGWSPILAWMAMGLTPRAASYLGFAFSEAAFARLRYDVPDEVAGHVDWDGVARAQSDWIACPAVRKDRINTEARGFYVFRA